MYNYTAIRKTSQVKEAKMSIYKTTGMLRTSYQRQVIKELGDSALVLMQYYFSNGNSDKVDLLDDTAVAKTLGWTPRKVRDWRSKLTKAGYILLTKHKVKVNGNTIEYRLNIFGKDKVAEYKSNPDDIVDVDINPELTA